MSKQEHIQTTVSAFLDRVKNCTAPLIQWFPIDLARRKNNLKERDWANSSGIYFFVQDDELKYVGRALDSTRLINRVFEQANAHGDPKWDKVINDDSTLIGVLPLLGDDAIWVPSLEVHIINSYRPKINKRR